MTRVPPITDAGIQQIEWALTQHPTVLHFNLHRDDLVGLVRRLRAAERTLKQERRERGKREAVAETR